MVPFETPIERAAFATEVANWWGSIATGFSLGLLMRASFLSKELLKTHSQNPGISRLNSEGRKSAFSNPTSYGALDPSSQGTDLRYGVPIFRLKISCGQKLLRSW
jgi:hypothetical protein